MDKEIPKISVIVPVYNGEAFLGKCLGALFSSDHRSFEVIVVDDCSTDNSAGISRDLGACVVAMQRNSGPAAARNFAAESARGEILLFVDADVVVMKDTISKVAESFERQPEIAALFGSYDDAPAEQNFLSQYKNLQHHFVHQNSKPEASTFWAGLGAIRRDAFVKIGGFDCEKFEVPSIEDIELGVRLRAAGHKILLNREIQAKHLKKWKFVQLLRTEIFCRALPWSKLILTSQGMINDMNLRTSDRLSAALVALSIGILPFIFWEPWLSLVLAGFLLMIVFINLKIFRFFLEKKGLVFAITTLPWLYLYFLYSGMTFVYCWLRYAFPSILGFGKKQNAEST